MTSNVKLNSPYCRILFGLSLSDMLVSFAQTTSTFVAPSDSGTWGAMGNQATCTFQGIIGLLGTVSTPFYNLVLCIYYLCVVRYSMSDECFGRKVERHLHLFIILYSISIVTYIGARQIIRSNIEFSSWCYIGPYPSGCDSNSNLECTSGSDFKMVTWVLNYGPCLMIFVAELAIMGLICYTVYQQDKIMARYSFRQQIQNRNEEDGTTTTTRTNVARSRRFIEVRKQAILYFVAVLLTYGGIMIKQAVDGIVGSSPFPLIVYSRSLYTLQGLFNICVYMRPQVSTVRRQHPSLSLSKAIYMVLKTVHIADNRERMRRSSRHLSNVSISFRPGTRSSRRRTPPNDNESVTNISRTSPFSGATESSREERTISNRNSVEQRSSSMGVRFCPLAEEIANEQ